MFIRGTMLRRVPVVAVGARCGRRAPTHSWPSLWAGSPQRTARVGWPAGTFAANSDPDACAGVGCALPIFAPPNTDHSISGRTAAPSGSVTRTRNAGVAVRMCGRPEPVTHHVTGIVPLLVVVGYAV